MSEEKDSYDALALVSKGIIERLERELRDAKESNRQLKHDLDDMTQLAMTYKDENNRLEAKLGIVL